MSSAGCRERRAPTSNKPPSKQLASECTPSASMAGLAEMAATTNLVAATPTFAAMDAPTTTRDSSSDAKDWTYPRENGSRAIHRLVWAVRVRAGLERRRRERRSEER